MTAPTQGRIDDGVHRYPLRVYYEDTDAARHRLSTPTICKFAERARTEMLRCMRARHARIARRGRHHPRGAPRRRSTISRRRGSTTRLSWRRSISAASGAVIEIAQEVRREGALLARIALRVACIATARPAAARLPPALAAAARRRSFATRSKRGQGSCKVIQSKRSLSPARAAHDLLDRRRCSSRPTPSSSW